MTDHSGTATVLPITLVNGAFLVSWLNGKRSARANHSGRNRPESGPASSALDPYQVLGVPRAASKAEVRAAYLALIAKYHPDKVMHLGYEFQEIAKSKTQEIIRAYEVLSRN